MTPKEHASRLYQKLPVHSSGTPEGAIAEIETMAEEFRQARREALEEAAQLLEASKAEPDRYTRERRKELAAHIRALMEREE